MGSKAFMTFMLILIGAGQTGLVVREIAREDPKPIHLTNTTNFVVFPQDCNANPPMAFGGKLLSEMDRCAGITMRRFLYSSTTGAKDAVTVGIDKVAFRKGAEIKDLVFVTGTIIRAKNKTAVIKVVVERETAEKREVLVEGEYTFCAYDLAEKKAIPHGLLVGDQATSDK